MQTSLARIFLALTLWFSLMVVVTLLYWQHWLHAERNIPEATRIISVQKGDSLASVAYQLRQAELIRWPNVWRQFARIFYPTSIKAGEYQLGAMESPISILQLLQSGKVITYEVTLLEGKTFDQFIAALTMENKLTLLLAGLSRLEQMNLLNLAIEHPEGWFFPDTYQYTAGDSDVDILRRAHAKMKVILVKEWQNRQDDLPYQDPYQTLIMASIVERETGVARERAEIAGVFTRRLRLKMRLQTDPTVIYGLGSDFDGNLTRRHLSQANPYNTYMIHGLPPTPIAMPSGEAIHAVLNPAPGDALYFVAKGDGTHYFSVTLGEHNQAVQKYQKRQRVENYQSAPPLN